MNQTWIWGWHSVKAALENSNRILFKASCLEANYAKAREILKSNPCEIEILEKSLMNKKFGQAHQGIAICISNLNFWNLKDWLKKQKEDSFLLAFDFLQDPHNVGAIIRTAAAFNLSGVLLTKRKRPPFSGSLAKSAAGGIEKIPIIEVSNLAVSLDILKENGYNVFGLDERGTQEWPNANKKVLVLGQEGPGLRELTKKKCDVMLRISTCSSFGTLNVSVAAGVAISRLK